MKPTNQRQGTPDKMINWSLPVPLERVAERGLTTSDAVQSFLVYARRYAENTQRRYRDVLQKFCKFAPVLVQAIKPEHIDRFLLSRRISNNSRNELLTPIKSFYNYLNAYFEFENIAKRIKGFKTAPSNQRVITESELHKILEVAKPREKAVIKFLAFTGLRAQEFCDLTPGSISSDKKQMTIIGKGRKRRIVPLNDTCRQCLPLIFPKSLPLVHPKKFTTRDSLSGFCKKLSHKASIPLFGPHALRHYFVTQLIKRGVPITIISKIVGHSSPLITTKIYCHLTTPDFLGVTDILDK